MEKQDDIVQIFLDYLKKIKNVSPEKQKIFNLLEEHLFKFPEFSQLQYLKQAFIFFENVSKSFIEMRSDRFFIWLLNQLSQMENDENMKDSLCFVFPIIHKVSFPFQFKEVLGLLIHFNGIEPNHIILEKIKNVVLKQNPNTYLVEGSTFHLINTYQKKTTIYLEIQKDRIPFIEEEILQIKQQASEHLLEEIKKFSDSIILPSNRELLIKAYHLIIDTLYPGDLPHVCIDFSKKINETYHFSGLICQIREDDVNPIQDLLQHPNIFIDATSQINKEDYCKEGATVSIEIKNVSNPIEARKEASTLIQSLIGPFRDVNGGLLEKIEENFDHFSKEMKLPRENLEEFFYKISPQENQATASPLILKTLYLALQRQKKEPKEKDYEVEENPFAICTTIKLPQVSFESELKNALFKVFPNLLIASTKTNNSNIVSCAIQKNNLINSEIFKSRVERFYKEWAEKNEVKQTLKLCSKVTFTSFDPRIGTEEETSHMHNMLFEGLLRSNPQGTLENAIAERIEISENNLQYRFFLKKTFWSDGTLLTAKDFEHSWKMNLHPNFNSPMNYLFFCINNATEAKKGTLPLESIGIRAVDDSILEVQLCYPVPYFLELCALSAFSPICKALDYKNPSWPSTNGSSYICNGPFKLEKIQNQKEITLIKNEHYWENNRVKLEKVNIYIRSEEKCIDLFINGHVDGIFNPFCKINPSYFPRLDKPVKKLKGNIKMVYLYLNLSEIPFKNKKIRQAISQALCREHLVSNFYPASVPQYSLYSPNFSTVEITRDEAENLSYAQKLFKEGLDELKIKKNEIDSENIYISSTNKFLGELLVEQINSVFHLNWKVEVENHLTHFLLKGEKTKLSIYGWINRISDPGYFLELFASKNKVINLFYSLNTKLQKIINKIQNCSCNDKRRLLHTQAERLLYEEKFLIPLFYTIDHSVMNQDLYGVYSNQFTEFDIRNSYRL